MRTAATAWRKLPMPIRDLLEIAAFVAIWILLQRVILPRLGVST